MAPINALRGSQYNFGIFLGKPRTELMRGMTCEQATDVRDTMDKMLIEEFMKQFKNKEVSNGTEKKGTGQTSQV